jgi:DNA-binding MarR family transcriptional regulator
MLDQLRAMGVFACVVEKSSFSGAARELGITTSAVSQQIRSLEHEMDVTLLHRSTRKLSLTEAGQAFFSVAKKCWLPLNVAKFVSMNCATILLEIYVLRRHLN